MTTTTVFYRLRMTLEYETIEPTDHIMDGWAILTKHWWDYLAQTGYIHSKATCGFECKDKCGEFCRPHFHIHFDSRSKKDTIVKGLKTEFLKHDGTNLKGNNMYALKIDPFPENDAKFFGYPIKQGGFYQSQGFDDLEMEIMRSASAQMYSTTCEINAKKADHRETANTLFDRLTEYLDTVPQCKVTDVVKFYMAEKRSLNPTIIKGYWALYCLNSGRMTVEAYALKFL